MPGDGSTHAEAARKFLKARKSQRVGGSLVIHSPFPALTARLGQDGQDRTASEEPPQPHEEEGRGRSVQECERTAALSHTALYREVADESGTGVQYITRNQAIKKLQCTLGDFRRLCILKGQFSHFLKLDDPRN